LGIWIILLIRTGISCLQRWQDACSGEYDQQEDVLISERFIMANPWEEIDLSDYENHMKLDSVMQIQAINEMMKDQLDSYPVSSVMVFGISGGNGLEHIQKEKYKKVYGVDINASYLNEVTKRYPTLDGTLECLCINLMDGAKKLPPVDLVIANLVIEYIGYACFQKAVQQVASKYVSCIIQINTDDRFVSDSPYLHVFDGLKQVHHPVEENALVQAMSEIRFYPIKTLEQPLPNGKKFVQLDFER